jgi:hypothetical protein
VCVTLEATDATCEGVLSPSSAYSTCPLLRPGGLSSPSAPRGSCPIRPPGDDALGVPLLPARGQGRPAMGADRGRWNAGDEQGSDRRADGDGHSSSRAHALPLPSVRTDAAATGRGAGADAGPDLTH